MTDQEQLNVLRASAGIHSSLLGRAVAQRSSSVGDAWSEANRDVEHHQAMYEQFRNHALFLQARRATGGPLVGRVSATEAAGALRDGSALDAVEIWSNEETASHIQVTPSPPPVIHLTPPNTQGDTVIKEIVNEALRVAPHSDVTVSLIRRNYPALAFTPDMEPDEIRNAIAALRPPPPPPPPAPPPTISVAVCCTMTELKSRIESYKVDFCFNGDVNVPVDVVAGGENAINDWVRDWWMDYYSESSEGDPYDKDFVADSTNSITPSGMSIDTDGAMETYNEEYDDDE